MLPVSLSVVLAAFDEVCRTNRTVSFGASKRLTSAPFSLCLASSRLSRRVIFRYSLRNLTQFVGSPSASFANWRWSYLGRELDSGSDRDSYFLSGSIGKKSDSAHGK